MSTETGTTPAQAPVADTPPVATPTPTPTSPPTLQVPPPGGEQKPGTPPLTVPITLEQLQAFNAAQARVAELEAQNRKRDQDAHNERVKALTESGETKKAMDLQQQESQRAIEMERVQRTTAEQRASRFARDSKIQTVLSGYNLNPGAAEQLTIILAPGLLADPQGESFTVRTPQFQSCEDYIAAQLAHPNFAHFLRPMNQGAGTAGTIGAGQAAPTPGQHPAAPPQPKNFGEAIVLQMAELAKNQPSDPRLNPSAAMGLNRRSMVRTS